MSKVKQLDKLKSEDKFPVSEWAERGLDPSSDQVRLKMNNEVNEFIDFVKTILNSTNNDLTESIQSWLNNWDDSDFEIEEAEYIADVMNKVITLSGVNPNDILI